MKRHTVFILGMLMFFFFAGAVQAGQKAPARFEAVAGSGGVIVRDNNTGLEWQRCPYGQSWTGSGCTGAAWRGTWDNALNLTVSGGFRLPTLDELKTLVPCDRSVFPGPDWFWSSTPRADHKNRAWCLHLYYGRIDDDYTSYGRLARLVRTRQ